MTEKEKTAFDGMYFAIQSTLQALSCGDIINGDCAPEDRHDCVRLLDDAKDDADRVFRSMNAQSIFVEASGEYKKQARTVILSDSEESAVLDAYESNALLWPTVRTILLDRVPELRQKLK